MIAAVATTVGLGIASALVPVLNIETYLAVVATRVSSPLDIYLATAAAAGQTIGKLAWYLGAARLTETGWVARKLAKPSVASRHQLWTERLRERRFLSTVVLFLSASAGLPPLLVMAVVAGTMRFPIVRFAVVCFVGRFLRFCAIMLGVDLVL